MEHRPHPRFGETYATALMLVTLVGVAVLWFIVPDARVGLDASAGVLVAMLPAAVTGVGLRTVVEMMEGRRWYRQQWTLYGTAVSSLLLGVGASVLVERGLAASERVQVNTAGWTGVLAVVLPLIAVGLVVLAARAGYADGDDHTWRMRHDLA